MPPVADISPRPTDPIGDAYDAVVIGAGPNGLAAATTLAEAGRSVLLCEAQSVAGGALRTEELTLPGFRHDTYSAVHPAAAASPVFARWPLADHGLTWVHPEVAMAHPGEDGTAVALHRDLEVTRASLNAQSPGDGDRWVAFAEPYLDHFEALRHTFLGGFPPIGGAVRLLAGLKLQGALEFARLALLAAEALSDELFHGDTSAAWLHGSCLHGDVPPQGSGSAIAAAYLQLMGHAVGWPSPEGGAGALAGALVSHLRSLGGHVAVDAPVEQITTRGSRVTGVRVHGREVRAGRVLCDVSPSALLRLTGEGLDAGYRRRLLRYRYGPGTVKLDWALSAPIPWTAPEPRAAGTVHVGGSQADIGLHADDLHWGRPSQRPFLLLGQQSLADPTRAPAGQHTGWAYTHVKQGSRLDQSELDGLVERMEEQVERFAPGFRDVVLERAVLAPGDLEAGNANLVGGDVGDGSMSLDQLIFRPVPSLSPYRTPLKGLYLASAATFPGGAVHGVCGNAAAVAALHDERIPLR